VTDDTRRQRASDISGEKHTLRDSPGRSETNVPRHCRCNEMVLTKERARKLAAASKREFDHAE